MVTVTEVRTRRDVKDFISLPYRLYDGSPFWVPPLRISIKRQLAFAARPKGEITAEHFIARTPDGRCVGRIAAAVHAPYVEKYGPIGFFGFFECEQNREIGAALLAAAEQWVGNRGLKQIAGPYSYTTAQDVGFLVDGFDTPCSLLQPHHPPYYREFVESCGYRQKLTSSVFVLSRRKSSNGSPNAALEHQRAMTEAGLSLRYGNLARYKEDMELIRTLFCRCFEDSSDWVPHSQSMFDFLAGDLRRLLRPDLIQLIELRGQPVGFLVLFPEISGILRHCRGSVLRYILNERKVRRLRSLVVVMMGRDPEALGAGVGRCIAGQIAQLVDSGPYDTVFTTRVHGDNEASKSLFTRIGAVESRHYAVFDKDL